MRFYSLNTLVRMYLQQHPDWSVDQAREKSIVIRRAVDTLNKAERRNDDKFYGHMDLFGDQIDDPGYEPEEEHD